MADPAFKPSVFTGGTRDNVEQFLKGIELTFSSDERKNAWSDERKNAWSDDVKVYFVLQNIKAGSAASAERFVRRLDEGTTSSFSKVCEALRTRFGNDEEQAEERRKAEVCFLELRQCRGEDLDDYTIKTARRVARYTAPENEHLVATQFVGGLDSRELRVHVMTSLGARPKMNETIIKVRRTSSMPEDERPPLIIREIITIMRVPLMMMIVGVMRMTVIVRGEIEEGEGTLRKNEEPREAGRREAGEEMKNQRTFAMSWQI